MRLQINGSELTIEFEGLERIWALSNGVRIASGSIKRVEWAEQIDLPYEEVGWRVGTAVPWVLVAGWYFSKKAGTSLLYLPRAKFGMQQLHAESTLSIELHGGKYHWIRISPVDQTVAKQLLDWQRAGRRRSI